MRVSWKTDYSGAHCTYHIDLNIVLRVVVSDSAVAFVELAELFEEFVRVIGNGKTKRLDFWLFQQHNTFPALCKKSTRGSILVGRQVQNKNRIK